ncbi:neutral zinc metallopeptidase [Nonomuraea sp. K274]|uniref:Neutral zinc metallopeptidase n=1 Tax=Nonomuraea cypriaca TaxID=1187855 RepID=A0A931F0B4_9ACTN|nr:neutral zinc metallopeptidase [Nonomuraea cypriaca]MBF8190714.1 neutral zinc metallopeptidase [Nonomuraea cypriaca]
MKLLWTATLAGALMVPLTGTATAYPVKHPKLIDNALYAAGRLPTTTCEEPSVKRNDRKRARAYLDAVVACLETTWKQHLTGAGLPYEPIKVRHYDRIPTKYCGFTTGKDDSQAWYCPGSRTLAVQLGKSWLKDPYDLFLFNTAASMYGYHVQNLVGITDAYDAIPYRNKSELYEQGRRESLQAECLGDAFLKSVWPMKGRTAKDWNHYLSVIEGDGPGDKRELGKTATIRSWAKRGFAAGDPGSCDTWTASSSKVA